MGPIFWVNIKSPLPIFPLGPQGPWRDGHHHHRILEVGVERGQQASQCCLNLAEGEKFYDAIIHIMKQTRYLDIDFERFLRPQTHTHHRNKKEK